MTPTRFVASLIAGCLVTAISAAGPSAHAATVAPHSHATPPAEVAALMSDKEQTEWRARMWAAKTDEERDRLRAEHHDELKKRAQAKGISIPDTPPPMPGGMGMMGQRDHRMGPATAQPPCAASAPRCEHPRHMRPRHHRQGPMRRMSAPASAASAAKP